MVGSNISLPEENKETYRLTQEYSRFVKAKKALNFLQTNRDLALNYIVDGKDIEIEKIQPQLIEVESGSRWEILFRWWCLTWWSIPYERSFGRQMRFVIFDKYHKSIIGLIGLHSPILAWGPRDQYLSIKTGPEREWWVNQSLNAQRVGALPPYNDLLAGKLIASFLVSREIRNSFSKKYRGQKTLMQKRILPSQLLFITTTGAFGKSPIYERLSYQKQKLSFFLGYTKGSGSFHIPDNIYSDMLDYLSYQKIDTARGYGTGPSRKMKLIRAVMDNLGYTEGTNHGIKRGLYLFTALKNLHNVINCGENPEYTDLSINDLSDFWKSRWILPRAKSRQSYRNFIAKEYIDKEFKAIENYGI